MRQENFKGGESRTLNRNVGWGRWTRTADEHAKWGKPYGDSGTLNRDARWGRQAGTPDGDTGRGREMGTPYRDTRQEEGG